MRKPTPLKRAIFESGRSQREIAQAVGIDEGHFSRIVNGLHPTQDLSERIAREIGRQASDLFPDGRVAA